MDSGNSRLFRPSGRSNPNPSTRPPEMRMKQPEWTKDDLDSPAVKKNWDLRLLACCMPWTMSAEDGNRCCDLRIWCHGSLPSDPGHTCLDPLLFFESTSSLDRHARRSKARCRPAWCGMLQALFCHCRDLFITCEGYIYEAL